MNDSIRASHRSMMTRAAAIRCLLLLLIFAGRLPSAFAADLATTRKALESCYRKMDRAATRLDVPGYMIFAAAHLVAVSDGVTFYDRRSFERHLSEDFNATRKMYTFASTIDHLTALDNGATVDLTTHLVADTVDSEGHYGTKGVTHHVDIQMQFHNEWKRTNGRWVLMRFVSKGASGTMDGKPIGPEK